MRIPHIILHPDNGKIWVPFDKDLSKGIPCPCLPLTTITDVPGYIHQYPWYDYDLNYSDKDYEFHYVRQTCDSEEDGYYVFTPKVIEQQKEPQLGLLVGYNEFGNCYVGYVNPLLVKQEDDLFDDDIDLEDDNNGPTTEPDDPGGSGPILPIGVINLNLPIDLTGNGSLANPYNILSSSFAMYANPYVCDAVALPVLARMMADWRLWSSDTRVVVVPEYGVYCPSYEVVDILNLDENGNPSRVDYKDIPELVYNFPIDFQGFTFEMMGAHIIKCALCMNAKIEADLLEGTYQDCTIDSISIDECLLINTKVNYAIKCHGDIINSQVTAVECQFGVVSYSKIKSNFFAATEAYNCQIAADVMDLQDHYELSQCSHAGILGVGLGYNCELSASKGISSKLCIDCEISGNFIAERAVNCNIQAGNNLEGGDAAVKIDYAYGCNINAGDDGDVEIGELYNCTIKCRHLTVRSYRGLYECHIEAKTIDFQIEDYPWNFIDAIIYKSSLSVEEDLEMFVIYAFESSIQAKNLYVSDLQLFDSHVDADKVEKHRNNEIDNNFHINMFNGSTINAEIGTAVYGYLEGLSGIEIDFSKDEVTPYRNNCTYVNCSDMTFKDISGTGGWALAGTFINCTNITFDYKYKEDAPEICVPNYCSSPGGEHELAWGVCARGSSFKFNIDIDQAIWRTNGRYNSADSQLKYFINGHYTDCIIQVNCDVTVWKQTEQEWEKDWGQSKFTVPACLKLYLYGIRNEYPRYGSSTNTTWKFNITKTINDVECWGIVAYEFYDPYDQIIESLYQSNSNNSFSYPTGSGYEIGTDTCGDLFGV